VTGNKPDKQFRMLQIVNMVTVRNCGCGVWKFSVSINKH